MKTAKHASKTRLWVKLRRTVSLLLAGLCLMTAVSAMPRALSATSMSDLQKKLEQIQSSMNQHKQELADAKKRESAAAALEEELREQVSVIQSQIAVLKGEIASVQNAIGQKEQQITAKEAEIDQKELDIENQWADFKTFMGAMQELREGGSVAMLSAVTDLYQLLTFNEMMQDISVKETSMLDALEAAKEELENDHKQLESEKASLETQKANLDAKNYQMQSKQSELNSSIAQAKLTQDEAAAAQKEAQEAIESDEMDYEAVQQQIQAIISAAASSQSQLSFTGFICPLKSYSRISSEYGYRTNPVTGVYKLHGGIDFAAPAGTPIYAAAGGYVSVAGWSTGGYGNYVVIYHGTMNDGKAYSTLYGHMSRIAAKQGTYVKQGDIIGYVGSTGNSTGNHLHLEVWQGKSNAGRVNPRSYVPIG